MNKSMILASVFALAVGTVGCGNSQGQSSSLVDVGPSIVDSASPDGSTGTLTTLGKGGKGGGGTGGGTGTIGGGGGTISLVLLNSTDGLPHFGQYVTFNVSTSATAYPYVTLTCYVNGVADSSATNAMFPGSLGEDFKLGPTTSWTSGAADCTANLENRYSRNGRVSTTVLTSMSFHVYP